MLLFCRTEHLPSAVTVYLLAAGSHAVIAALVIAGVIHDPGFYPVRRACSVEAQIAGQLILQQAYGICFFLARMTRKSSLRAIEHLQRATRLAAQRDAQVVELCQDLDRALKIGGPGRFTGQYSDVPVSGLEPGKALDRLPPGKGQRAVQGDLPRDRGQGLCMPFSYEAPNPSAWARPAEDVSAEADGHPRRPALTRFFHCEWLGWPLPRA